MNLSIIIFGFFFSTVGSFRIVGGTNGYIDQFPYQVSIRWYGQDHCGGAIISERHVLTAAHCIGNVLVYPFKNVTVNTGTDTTEFQGHIHRIAKVVGHPDYQESPHYRNDIAVITLADPIIFDENQQKINLPNQDIQGGEKGIITGWGFTSFEIQSNPVNLQKADMTLVTSSDCKPQLEPLPIYAEQVCAVNQEGIGSCMGDSGGPLIVDDVIVGVTSWGVPCAKGYPDVYTKVYAYMDFIKSVMESI